MFISFEISMSIWTSHDAIDDRKLLLNLVKVIILVFIIFVNIDLCLSLINIYSESLI